VAFGPLAQPLKALRSILNDALYRGSLTLLINTVATSAIGFVFWTLAARRYPATAVGVFSGVTSGVGLLAAIAALGLPNTMIRHVAQAKNARALLLVAVFAIVTVGAALCFLTVVALGPHLPAALHLQQRGRMMYLVAALVVVTAVSGTLDASLVATRATDVMLTKNLIGSAVKLTALSLLVSYRSSGLLVSYGLGLVTAAVLSSAALARRLGGKAAGPKSSLSLRKYLSFTSGNYLATIMGILPLSVVPLEVLAERGAAETARFAVAFLIAGFLNLIPSTVAQVMFAEASRQGATLGRQLRKAIRGVYGLLLPALVITVAGAPILLRLFGASYVTAATGCLRVLAVSALPAAGAYLVDSMLIARDRTAAYVFMNGANAALVLAGVGILLPRGLTAAAIGWALAQGASLVLGVIVLATGKAGRHHPRVIALSAGEQARQPPTERQRKPVAHSFEAQIRELLATWPLMPTSLIAEQIGWDQPLQVLVDQVAQLRSAYMRPYQHLIGITYPPGETAQCGLWFPPIEIPVGFGQTRSTLKLPVLTMITGYSRWLSAMLIPSTQPEDLRAGSWELLMSLGAVPRALTWDRDDAFGGSQDGRADVTGGGHEFFRSLGTRLVAGKQSDAKTRGLIERAHAYLEHSFLTGRNFSSPANFNAQLGRWLETANTRRRQPPNLSPIELLGTDKQAMLPLPSVPPAAGWRLSMKVQAQPFVHFDSNAYSVSPATLGRAVELVADLQQVSILCDGKLAAKHNRSWASGCTISDPGHLIADGVDSRIETA
jgi:O-antigen/teichoic acid export membrane protein